MEIRFIIGLTQFSYEYLRTARRWRGLKPRQRRKLRKSYINNIKKQISGFEEGWKTGRLEETLRPLSSELPTLQLCNASEDRKYKFNIQTCLYCLLIFCLSLAIGTGCTTQETSNPVTPENSSEIVLENYRLTENETWDPERTYIVNNTLEVPQDITLTIPSGTTVKFGRNARITVRGILKVGTPLAEAQVIQLVRFTSDKVGPAPGDWNGIFFDHTHDLESFIRGAVIEYATIALDIKTTSPTVAACTLRLNETAIALDGSDAHIRHNDIIDNDVGISTIGRQTLPRIEKNNVARNETGIFCENVQSIIQHNNLNANVFALRLNVKFDFRVPNNWWGSSDTIEIMDTIIDGGDPGLIPKQIGTVLYEPFAETQIVDAGFPYPTLLKGE